MTEVEELELEQERLERIAEYKDMMEGLSAPDISPGSYSFHEVVHSSLLAHENVERTLLEHPAIFHDKELYDKATEISQKLFELYQVAALKHIPDEPWVPVAGTERGKLPDDEA